MGLCMYFRTASTFQTFLISEFKLIFYRIVARSCMVISKIATQGHSTYLQRFFEKTAAGPAGILSFKLLAKTLLQAQVQIRDPGKTHLPRARQQVMLICYSLSEIKTSLQNTMSLFEMRALSNTQNCASILESFYGVLEKLRLRTLRVTVNCFSLFIESTPNSVLIESNTSS